VVAAKIVAAMSFALPSIALVATAAGVTENVSLDGHMPEWGIGLVV
jgi:hypothetical protein